MKRGTGAYPVDVGRLSNNRPRIQQFEYLPDRSSREKKQRWEEEGRRCVPQVLRGKRRRAKKKAKEWQPAQWRRYFSPWDASGLHRLPCSLARWSRTIKLLVHRAIVLGALDFIRPPSSLQGGVRHQPAWLSSTIVPTPIKKKKKKNWGLKQSGHWWPIFCNGSFQGFFFFSILWCQVAIIHKK